MGAFSVGGNYQAADPRLVAIAEAAAANSPYDVVLFSGDRNGGGTSQHDTGKAIDIVLVDPQTGQEIPNLGAGGAPFEIYEGFARDMRAAQQQIAPELGGNFRWGGYFGPSGLNPTGLDLMHFDLGPTQNMALGTWEGGLNANGQQFVASAGGGQVYSATQRGPAPAGGQYTNRYGAGTVMAYAPGAGASPGQAAINAATGPGQNVTAPAPSVPGPFQLRPMLSRQDRIASRAAGGLPVLDWIGQNVAARREGRMPLLERLQTALQGYRQNRGQSGAPTPPAPIMAYAGSGGGGGSQSGSPSGRMTVREQQAALRAAGFDPGPIDGIIGPRTRAAIRAYQQANGLTVDGIVGPQTTAALQRSTAGQPQVTPGAAVRDPSPPGVPSTLPGPFIPNAPRIAPVTPSVERPGGYAPGSLPGRTALARPVPLPPVNPSRVPPAKAPLDYSIPVASSGLPQLPGGYAPGSLPGRPTLTTAAPPSPSMPPLAAGETMWTDPSRRAMPSSGLGMSAPVSPVERQPLPQIVPPTPWAPITLANYTNEDLIREAQGGNQEALAALQQRGFSAAGLARYGIAPPAPVIAGGPPPGGGMQTTPAGFQPVPAGWYGSPLPPQTFQPTPNQSRQALNTGAASMRLTGGLPAPPLIASPKGLVPGQSRGPSAVTMVPDYTPAGEEAPQVAPNVRMVQTTPTTLVPKPGYSTSVRDTQIAGGVMPAARDDLTPYPDATTMPAYNEMPKLVAPNAVPGPVKVVQTVPVPQPMLPIAGKPIPPQTLAPPPKPLPLLVAKAPTPAPLVKKPPLYMVA